MCGAADRCRRLHAARRRVRVAAVSREVVRDAAGIGEARSALGVRIVMGRNRRVRVGLVLAALALGSLGACARNSRHEAADTRAAPLAGAVTLRVMSFNIEWGGANVRFQSVIDAIRASGADIVGVQEAEGNLQRIAADLGWHYNLRNYVVSRYPILDPPGADGRYVYVEIRPGRVVAMANVHLPSDPYGPDWIRDGREIADVLNLERRLRLPKIEPYLRVLPGLAANGVPVFLSGDFNAPSHTDWTEAVVRTRRFPAYAVDWPVSRVVVTAGLRDSYRDMHPDPLTQPGFTWWAKRQRIRDYNPGENDAQDRIDLLWYAGPARVTRSEVVGEAEGPGVSIVVMPWPSDHRGVVSSFEVVPAPLPLFVAAERRVTRADEPLRIVYHAPGLARGAIAVERLSEAAPGPAVERIPIDTARGGVELPAHALAAGSYQAALIDASGRARSRNEFWILDPDAAPSLSISGSRFAAGAPVPIRWQNAPGNRNDWLAVFEASAPRDAQEPGTWAYLGARSAGALDLAPPSADGAWPLPPGRYVVRLLKDDSYEILAESPPFTVE